MGSWIHVCEWKCKNSSMILSGISNVSMKWWILLICVCRFFLYVFLAALGILLLVGAQQLVSTFGVSPGSMFTCNWYCVWQDGANSHLTGMGIVWFIGGKNELFLVDACGPEGIWTHHYCRNFGSCFVYFILRGSLAQYQLTWLWIYVISSVSLAISYVAYAFPVTISMEVIWISVGLSSLVIM